jgi:hypothetical protein
VFVAARGLKIRTSRGMIALSAAETAELRERLRRLPSARSAEGTIAVSANASTSVSFTETEQAAVLEVLEQWLAEVGAEGMGIGPASLREALVGDLGRAR